MSFLNEQWWQIMKWHLFIIINYTAFFRIHHDTNKICRMRKYQFHLKGWVPISWMSRRSWRVPYVKKFKPHPARFSVFGLTFGGLGIFHGISNCCSGMNCFCFAPAFSIWMGREGVEQGKKLRAGHVISVNNKTRHFFSFGSHPSLSSW